MSEQTLQKTVPRHIGRYEIVGPLASGGMAEILLARLAGPSGFMRPVVIKRILPHLAQKKDFVDMFLDEARIVAGIRHPNVVQVTELGHEEGELFLAMEYLEGESTSGLMRRTQGGIRLSGKMIEAISKRLPDMPADSVPLEIITPGPLVSKDHANDLAAMFYLSDPMHCIV